MSFYPNRKHLDGVLRCVEGIGEDGDFRVVRIFLIVVDSIVRICPEISPISGYIWVSGSFVREMAYFPDYWGQLVEGVGFGCWSGDLCRHPSLRDFVAALRHPRPACGGALQIKERESRSSKLVATLFL